MTVSRKKSFRHNLSLWIPSLVLAIIALLAIVFARVLSQNPTFTGSSAAGPTLANVAILGDSSSDEYRAEDNRAGGTQYANTTLIWNELLSKAQKFSFGPWGSNRGEPRRSGFEYNWARSASKIHGILDKGQLTGVLSQIANNQVKLVIVQAGAQDFMHYNNSDGYLAICSGSMSNAQLEQKINGIVTDLTFVMDEIQKTGKAKVIVATLPDYSIIPSNRNLCKNNPAGHERVRNAVNRINTAVTNAAAARSNAFIADQNSYVESLTSRLDSSGAITVGGEKIVFFSSGNEPHNGLLADNIHGGTVLNGILANWWIEQANRVMGTAVQPFTDNEILVLAGIKTAPPSATPTATPTVVPTQTATPTKTPTATPTSTPTSTTPTKTPLATPKPTPTATATIRPTATPVPADPYLRYCPLYRQYRGLFIRLLSPAQVREWDTRCGI